MKKWYFGGLLIVLFLVSCTEKKEKIVEKIPVVTHPFVFSMEHYFSEEEFTISFPVWFNDSIIRANKIKTITRKIYSSSPEMDTVDTTLKEVKKYTFNKEGQVSSLEVEQYYDNLMVGSMSFNFSERDEHGFAIVTSRKGKKSTSDEEIQQQFRFYEKDEYADKYLVYLDMNTGNYRFYMLDEKNWGPLSVDSILNPTEEDIVICGNPLKPGKRYQVENRVNEFNVVEYTYDNNEGDLKQISFDKYPFHYKRSILYNDKGRCTGFVDSTFSNEKYLTRRESIFQFEKALPVQLIHDNKSGKSAAGYYQYETFEYSYFE